MLLSEMGLVAAESCLSAADPTAECVGHSHEHGGEPEPRVERDLGGSERGVQNSGVE